MNTPGFPCDLANTKSCFTPLQHINDCSACIVPCLPPSVLFPTFEAMSRALNFCYIAHICLRNVHLNCIFPASLWKEWQSPCHLLNNSSRAANVRKIFLILMLLTFLCHKLQTWCNTVPQILSPCIDISWHTLTLVSFLFVLGLKWSISNKVPRFPSHRSLPVNNNVAFAAIMFIRGVDIQSSRYIKRHSVTKFEIILPGLWQILVFGGNCC